MKQILKFGLSLVFLASAFVSNAQDEEDEVVNKWKDKIDFGGYVKYMNTNQFADLDAIVTDNLIHNRLNFKFYPDSNWTFS